MASLYLNRNLVLQSNCSLEDADYILLGVPFDCTSTHRPGSRFAPTEVRREFMELEKEQGGKSFFDVKFHDAGNLDVVYGNAAKTIERMGEAVGDLTASNKGARIIALGGEHLITLPVVKALGKQGKFTVVSLDAHLDLKDDYMGEKLSHSTVMRRISEGGINVVELGVRTFDNSERECAKKQGIVFCGTDEGDIRKTLKGIEGSVYLSIDFDVLDPGTAPGVGNPEAGGITFQQLQEIVRRVKSRTIAVDFTEVCPPFDHGNATSTAAARLLLDYMLA